MFWLLVAVISLVAIAVIVCPLFFAAGRGRPSQGSSLTALFEERLAEIDADVSMGHQGVAELDEIKTELSLSLLDEHGARREPDQRNPGVTAVPWGLIASVLVLPILALAMYFAVGEPNAQALKNGGAVLDLDPATDAVEIADWRVRLEARVAGGPEDYPSWYLLGHLHLKERSFARAAQAFGNARSGFPQDVSLDLYWLQARYLAAGGLLDQDSVAIAQRVLEKDPNQPMVLELLAVAAYRSGKFAQAVTLLNRALSNPLAADHQQSLLIALDQARAELGDLPGAIDVTLNATETPPAGATLFVIARPPGGGMPYAVVRRPAHPLPAKVRLDDAVSMNPALPISAAGSVEIVTRISYSGSPMSHPGDWEWHSEPLNPGEHGSSVPIQLNAILTPPES